MLENSLHYVIKFSYKESLAALGPVRPPANVVVTERPRAILSGCASTFLFHPRPCMRINALFFYRPTEDIYGLQEKSIKTRRIHEQANV